jgi:hypothetical protein
MYIVGIDPGPITGIFRIWLEYGHGPTRVLETEAAQVTPRLMEMVLATLADGDRTAIAVEKFVVGPRAAQSATPGAGQTARLLVGQVADWAFRYELRYHARSAAEVKPWATDTRLAAAGLMEPTTGMRHARDAARHALFAAVKTYGLPDPLSARAGVR